MCFFWVAIHLLTVALWKMILFFFSPSFIFYLFSHLLLLRAVKILLIHAGGYSKRLPNVSVVGKIFAALPFGSPVYTMLEMKLAGYIDFPAKMSPGVFVTCADDIELLDPEGDLHFHDPGFTALGHPSTLEIGTTHGVFVIAKESRESVVLDRVGGAPCRNAVCERFLHKPSVATMQAEGAPTGEDEVYTDSAFYFDRATGKSLLAFFVENKPLTCEVDAYGDFLQALGPNATADYTGNSANVISETDDLAVTRLKLYNHLKGSRLNVVLCNWSKFYHIGTLPEYLHHYTSDPIFKRELGCSNRTFSAEATPIKGEKTTLIHSETGKDVTVGDQTVLEYSVIGDGCSIGPRCLVSSVTLPAGASVPGNLFLHTTSTTDGFVTIVFGTGEDLKSSAVFDAASEKLTYCNTPLGEALGKLGCAQSDIWPDAPKKCTLWSAALYPALPTAEESVTLALQVATAVLGVAAYPAGSTSFAGMTRKSMADIIATKDLDTILAVRGALREKIMAK